MQNFVVYKSSAGSGKTFTLVKEYLRLAIAEEDKLTTNYKRILALTFTNKAASEMKSRVIEALSVISFKSDVSTTGTLLCKELNISIQELKRRTKILLNTILHHYSDFSIGTIDSFTHKIIKTFAHDLELPVNFNIEMDIRGFYGKVIDTLFSQIGEDSYVSNLLIEYSLSKANDNKAWDPQQQIQEFSDLLQKENSEAFLEKLKQFSTSELETFRKEFIDYAKHYEQTLKNEGTHGLLLIQKSKLLDEDFAGKSRGPQTLFKKSITADIDLGNVTSKVVLDALTMNKWIHAESSNKAVLEKILPELSEILKTIVEFVNQNYSFYQLCKVLSKQMYPLMLLKKIEEISAEQKSEDRLVFISEFNQKISEIIHNEPTPFIYERLGDRYRNFLLDEFQDTSSLQWHNILPLLDNSLANGWLNLIVGDGKQSIYRWRNADVAQFSSLPEIKNPNQNAIIHEIQESISRNYKEDVLSVNFRSLRTIVDFNNSLFADLSVTLLNDTGKKIYQDQFQEIKNSNEGYITIHNGKKTKEEVESLNLELVIEHIKNALIDGFDYKDICIICRYKKTGSLLANHLLEEKIPVVSSDSLLLETNLEVNTILSYLKYITNKQDTISAAAVINYLFQSGTINEQEYVLFLENLAAKKTLFQIFQTLNIHLKEESIGLNNLFDNCIDIIQALKLNKVGYHYIRFFLDEVNEYLVQQTTSNITFFDWWENRKNNASMVIPETTNAVKIMTIHTSKGLEFPVVILPYCNWRVYQASDSWVNLNNERTNLPVSIISLSKKAEELGFEEVYEAELQDQLLDNLNLLYVACTRAVERLHVICAFPDTIKYESIGQWMDKHLETHYQLSNSNSLQLGKRNIKWSKEKLNGIKKFDLKPLTFTASKTAIDIKTSYKHNSSNAESAKLEGILIHWLLSKIITIDDIDFALTEAIIDGLIDKSSKPIFIQKLEGICRMPELKSYFRAGVKCKIEADIIQANGEILRPDRIIFEETETILMDYKTGKANDTKYFQQLLKYEAALISMGYKNIKKILVYVDEAKTITLN